MNRKMIVRISIDFVMTILLLLLMARQITGDTAHEWLGLGMFVLWIVHHILNHKWYKQLFKGKYTLLRTLQQITNILLSLSMLGLLVSGIILSRNVFAFLPLSGGLALNRPLHIVSAFWGFVLMALHLGLHWNSILTVIKKAVGTVSLKGAHIVLRLVNAAIAVYGIYAFIKNQFLSYMFLSSSFVIFDFEQPFLLFFAEYLSIMVLFVSIAHYVTQRIRKRAKRAAIAQNGVGS